MIRRMQPLLGTFVEVVLCDDSATAAQADAAFAAIQRVQQLASFHAPDSELNQLNRQPGQWLSLSRPLRRLLRIAHHLTLASNHGFDCSVGGWMVDAGYLPAVARSQPVAPRAQAAFLAFRGQDVMLTQAVWLVLDGIAKGFAIDLAVQALKHAGVKAGWINAGGDVRVFGDCQQEFEVRHRIQPLAHVVVSHGALCTSAGDGDDRFPAKLVALDNTAIDGCFSVISPLATLADALTKVVAACPKAQAQALLAAYQSTLLVYRR